MRVQNADATFSCYSCPRAPERHAMESVPKNKAHAVACVIIYVNSIFQGAPRSLFYAKFAYNSKAYGAFQPSSAALFWNDYPWGVYPGV